MMEAMPIKATSAVMTGTACAANLSQRHPSAAFTVACARLITNATCVCTASVMLMVMPVASPVLFDTAFRVPCQ